MLCVAYKRASALYYCDGGQPKGSNAASPSGPGHA